jgi:hypothetical protein
MDTQQYLADRHHASKNKTSVPSERLDVRCKLLSTPNQICPLTNQNLIEQSLIDDGWNKHSCSLMC